jgi:hypothetical protein
MSLRRRSLLRTTLRRRNKLLRSSLTRVRNP